jgi:hypothetical protein
MLEVVDVAVSGPGIPGVGLVTGGLWGRRDSELELAGAEGPKVQNALKALAVEQVLVRGGLHPKEIIERGVGTGNLNLHLTGSDENLRSVRAERVGFDAAALRAKQRKDRRRQKRKNADSRRPECRGAKA